MAKRRVDTMEENRLKLIAAARKAFGQKGFSAASMDALTADAGLTRGALYHNFGDKRGLMAAVVYQIDGEMAARAQAIGERAGGDWRGLMERVQPISRWLSIPKCNALFCLMGPPC